MLDLNLLPVFEAMLLEKNVTAAAAKMGLTQSAMSNALGRLRVYFQDPLFVKTRQGMMPTPRALELAGPLRDALALVRASVEQVESFDPCVSNRTFRIAMTDVGEMVFLPKLMKHLRALGATIQVQTCQLESEAIEEGLAEGVIDFAMGYNPDMGNTVSRARLFKEHYVCMTRADYEVKGSDKLTLKRFLDASHVLISSMGSGHEIIERTLDRLGYKRRIALRIPHFFVVPHIIPDTDLVVTMPYQVAHAMSHQARVRVHPLPVQIPTFDVSLFWHPRFENDPPLEWFRQLLMTLFLETPRGKS